ncbi:MAG: bis(5'-nucleosyl)-tetraphosphatase (symmetrical) YqeK [Lachnospiraceae bacterium]|nr:bis(5'-nucleosyl)-tetraphosphatase (symmetrical) YqeK [Lachnospiraceae bacterium]MBR5943422.1 bis(5'-nucleosyl)-tetraphosphatase (symmetrical) YqeK [Lachnospiraceae bacterium]
MAKSTEPRKIRNRLEKILDKKRFEHTLGVAYTAMNMASIFGEDIKKAELAGLLHDCAKGMSDEELLEFCKKFNITVTEFEKKNAFLLHAKVGSFIAASKYEISDKDILNAILNHTTGRPGMSNLEKIVFIADYIEPGRKTIPGLDEARKLAFTDLDKAMVFILENILGYLKSKNSEIDEKTVITYKYYKNPEDFNGDI